MGNERMLVVAAPFAGEAAEQRAYYVLLTKKSPESNPWALLSSTSSDDLKWGKFPWLQLGGGLLAIVFIGLYLQRIEVENPLRRLRSELHSLARQEVQKIDDRRYDGKLGGIARDINATIEYYTHAPLPKSETAKKDISAILDAKAGAGDGRSFDVSHAALSKSPPLPAAMAASLFGTPRSAPGLAGGPPPVPMAPPPAPLAAPAPAAPYAVAVAPTPPVPAPSFLPIPVSASARPLAVPPSEAITPVVGSQDPDEAHFNQVFEEYRAVRQNCGESLAGLSLEKFVAKLRSNRDQLVAKYQCRTAHFSVYEKDGKAAIRALPVRD